MSLNVRRKLAYARDRCGMQLYDGDGLTDAPADSLNFKILLSC